MRPLTKERLLLISGAAVLALLLVARAWMGSPSPAAKAAFEPIFPAKKQSASRREKKLDAFPAFFKIRNGVGKAEGIGSPTRGRTMNKRSKQVWLENVAWGLVVSMSVLQLTSGRILQTASADGPECVNKVPDGPAAYIACGACDKGTCPGRWRKTDKYYVCGPAESGYYHCSPSKFIDVEVGIEGDCVEEYSYLGIASCILAGAAGAGAAACTVVTSCAISCSGKAKGPKAMAACMTLCTAYAGYGAAAGGISLGSGCLYVCGAISSCVPGAAKTAYEKKIFTAEVCPSGG